MTMLIPTAKRKSSFTHGLFLWVCSLWMVALMFSGVSADSGNVVTGTKNGEGEEVAPLHTMTTNNRTTGYGIDPATACTDVNGNGQISPDECQGRDWSWTTTDPQIPAGLDTQNGNNLNYVTGTSSNSSFTQTSDQTVKSGPHLAVRYYNKPSVPNSTATTGVTSTSNGTLRDLHNEYGFDIVVDKKTDPLEPYYQRFQENYAVDAQQDVNGDMIGQAGVTYEKIVTEEDPSNPGVFNRYTVTGTATSGGAVGGAYSSQCQSGCPTDSGGTPVDPETGWSHPWQ